MTARHINELAPGAAVLTVSLLYLMAVAACLAAVLAQIVAE